MARIYVEVNDKFHHMIKEAALRRKKSIKEMTIMALSAWLKISESKQ